MTGAGSFCTRPLHRLQQLLAFVTGLVMLLVAAEMLGVLTRITSGGAALAQATVGRALGSTMRSRSWAAPLALGVFNALLPCQLIYAFAARAASTASPYEGMLTMLSFGLGTVPAMLAVGRLRAHSRLLLHTQLSRLAALIVLGFGLVTLLRALDWLPGGLHTHH
jgi:sulfite exporter TauE/SafE